MASNGLHTNGYTLVRALLDAQPDLTDADVDGESFLDAILRPHKCYYRAVRDLYASDALRGMAHITGGGVRDNLSRVLPAHLDAQVDLGAIDVLPVFKTLTNAASSTRPTWCARSIWASAWRSSWPTSTEIQLSTT